MSPLLAWLTARRVARQLTHDRRTIAMILLVPPLLMTLLRYIMDSSPEVFDRLGLTLLGVFPFVIMFLITSVTMLRERTSQTLERLLTTPIHKLDVIAGYAMAFGAAAIVQTIVTSAVCYWWLGLDPRGPIVLVVLVAAVNALLGVALGLLVSAFAYTEFQAVQFMPAIVLPQILLCGLIWPRDEMADWLQVVARVLPLTYAIEALDEIATHASGTATMWRDVGIVTTVAIAALALGATTLRRKTG